VPEVLSLRGTCFAVMNNRFRDAVHLRSVSLMVPARNPGSLFPRERVRVRVLARWDGGPDPYRGPSSLAQDVRRSCTRLVCYCVRGRETVRRSLATAESGPRYRDRALERNGNGHIGGCYSEAPRFSDIRHKDVVLIGARASTPLGRADALLHTLKKQHSCIVACLSRKAGAAMGRTSRKDAPLLTRGASI
jgi:hypothetical protein